MTERTLNISHKNLLGLGLVIFMGALWLHWPSVQGGFLTGMDDDKYLQQAERLQGLTWEAVKWAFTDTQPYYHPLPRLSHILDYQIWKTNAAGHHATSVVLHAFNAALAFGFLWTLLGMASLKTGERLATAFGVATVFAIHPLQVESVAWISGRTQLLCTTFGIGCLWVYIGSARKWLVCSLFVGALLSKPMAVTLPFVMLAIDYFPLRRFERLGWVALLREKAGLIALAFAMAVATIISESRTGGLMVPLAVVHWPQRVFLVAQSLLFYPWKLVWPASLEPFYPLLSGPSSPLLPVFPMALSIAVLVGLCIWRGQRPPALLAGLGAYVMLVLPVSGLLQTGGQTVAPRHAYLAMLPLLLLLGGLVVWAWRRSATVSRLALGCLLVCELCFFGIRTRRLTPVWHDDETLWRTALVHFPDFATGHYCLGLALADAGRIQEAIGEYEQAVRIIPDYAEARCNLGLALEKLHRTPEAIAQYEAALRIWPDYANAHYNLGLALIRLGKTQEAINHWEQAIRISPDFAEAHCNLGAAFETLGRTTEAAEQYAEALKFQPGLMVAQNGLARLQTTRQ